MFIRSVTLPPVEKTPSERYAIIPPVTGASRHAQTLTPPSMPFKADVYCHQFHFRNQHGTWGILSRIDLGRGMFFIEEKAAQIETHVSKQFWSETTEVLCSLIENKRRKLPKLKLQR